MKLYPVLNVSPTALQAGLELARRRREGAQSGLLPHAWRPASFDDALAIQSGVSQSLGWSVAAWKCALPAPGKLVVAPIYAPTVQEGVVAQAWARDGEVLVEPELAFFIGADLPVRSEPWTPAEVDAVVSRTHLALELVDSRYEASPTPSFEDHLADGLVNQGLVIGPEVDGDQAREAAQFKITTSWPGQAGAVREGRMPDGMPRLPLYWLAEWLREQGTGLQAGQYVITGSYAGAFKLPCAQPVHMQFGDLGTLAVRLQAREASIGV